MYRADEDGGVTLIGMCAKIRSPSFTLFGGRYSGLATIKLHVDGSIWSADVVQRDHDRLLRIRDANANDAIGRGKREIALVADDGWILRIKPGRKLASFYADCQTQSWSFQTVKKIGSR